MSDHSFGSDSAAIAALPTVREILNSPELALGAPEVVGSTQNVDQPVRWVHVVEGTDVESFLRGKEMVLTTGSGWPGESSGLVALARAFARAQTSCVVLELGTRFTQVPEAFAHECESLGIALILLKSAVQFVAVTEAVHSRIVSAQTEVLQARQEVSRDYTDMIARGVDPEQILNHTYALLGAPLLLQDPARRTVDIYGQGVKFLELRRDLVDHPERWHSSAIKANNAHWGFLLAPLPPSQFGDFEQTGESPGPLPRSTPQQHRDQPYSGLSSDERFYRQIGPPAGTAYIVGQAAAALAVGRLAAGNANPWRAIRDRRVLSPLATGNYASQPEFNEYLRALDLPKIAERAFGFALQLPTGALPASGRLSEQFAIAELQAVLSYVHAPAFTAAAPPPESTHAGSSPDDALDILSPHSSPASSTSSTQLLALIGTGQESEEQALKRALAVVREHWPQARIAVGRTATDFPAMGASLREASQALSVVEPELAHEAPEVIFAADHQLKLLVRGLSARPELPRFVQDALGPVLAYDRECNGDLISVLRAYLHQPANRSAAALTSHLSRSVFYQRLALIEELLAVNLSRGETISTLYTALLAHDALK